MEPGASDYADAANFELTPAGEHAGVVLLHGLGGELAQPRDYTGGVIDGHAATRLAADARLHGLTRVESPHPLTFDQLAADILALAEFVDLPAERVYIGVSMGAATALKVALQGRSGLRGLVLIRPAWLNAPHPANLAAFAVIADLLSRFGPAEGKARLPEHQLWQAVRRESVSMAASLLEQFDKPWALERVRRLVEIPADAPFADPAELAAVAVPTLVIGAPGDPVHPLAIAHQWSQWIPGSRYAQITARDENAERHRIDLRRTVDGFLATV